MKRWLLSLALIFVAPWLLLGHAAAQSNWPAASTEPLPTTPPRKLLAPLGRSLRIQFRSPGPVWTARVHRCERASDDQSFGGEPGCAVLVLENAGERRYLSIQNSFQVRAPQLVALPRPAGGNGLLLTETNAIELHADSWFLHLIEDDGGGPLLVFRTIFDACAWIDEDSSCTLARVKAKYVDVDADGDYDLDFAFVGPTGLRHHDVFVRTRGGRFSLPARYTKPDHYLSICMHDVQPPIGADAATDRAVASNELECPWFAYSLHGKANIHEGRGRGPIIATVEHNAPLDVVELRAHHARLGLPQPGWISTRNIRQRCDK